MMIKKYTHLIILISFPFVLVSCASTQEQDYYYDEITMRNKSFRNVSDVKIKVEKTGLVFSCSFIPPKGECSNKFRKRKYLGNPVTLSWVFNNGKKSTVTVQSKLPDGARSSKTLKGMLEIDNQGKINPYMYQE